MSASSTNKGQTVGVDGLIYRMTDQPKSEANADQSWDTYTLAVTRLRMVRQKTTLMLNAESEADAKLKANESVKFGKFVHWVDEEILDAADLITAASAAHTALHDLLKAYADIQEHYGLAPESSPLYVAAQQANRQLVAALAKVEVSA